MKNLLASSMELQSCPMTWKRQFDNDAGFEVWDAVARDFRKWGSTPLSRDIKLMPEELRRRDFFWASIPSNLAYDVCSLCSVCSRLDAGASSAFGIPEYRITADCSPLGA